ncbi:MAG: hypothetical protein AAFQ07_13990 [Chloroflexota bacterium]
MNVTAIKVSLMLCLLSLFGLIACTPNTAFLPLAEGKPTLLFFYTEN